MKTQKQKFNKFSILLFLCLIIQMNSLGKIYQNIISENTEYPKPCTYKDKNLLLITTDIGHQKAEVTKLTKDGRFVFRNAGLSFGYTPDANLIQAKKSDINIFSSHNKQNIAGQSSKETIVAFKEKNTIVKSYTKQNSIYKKTSIVALENIKL